MNYPCLFCPSDNCEHRPALIDGLFMAGESCAAASATGVDLDTFVPTAAYGTHFITLQDLRSH